MSRNLSKTSFQLAVPALFLMAIWVPPLSPGVLEGFFTKFPELCFFHWLTALDCPGCGLTRSMISFFSLHPKLSFQYHPLGPFIGIGVVVLWLVSFHRAWWESALRYSTQVLRTHAIGMAILLLAWGLYRNL